MLQDPNRVKIRLKILRRRNKNDFIYMEGDSSNTLYLIAEGKVKIAFMTDDGKEVLKADLYKPIDSQPETATAFKSK